MIEAIISGIAQAFSPLVLLVTFGGVIIGLFFGLLPGIGVMAFMAIILPLTFSWDPAVAISFMIALGSVSTSGGAITAILIGVPGTGPNAATVLDGYQMTKRGEGARAIGAMLCASALGGVLGGFVLAALIPVAYPIIMGFGSGEIFLVALLGLTLIATLSAGGMLKGLISACAGLLIAFVGVHSVSAATRFTFGSMYLYEGFGLIPVLMGLFALPAVFDMIMRKGAAISDVAKTTSTQTEWGQVYEGIKDVFRHWKLFLRSSAIGTIVGIIPGVGADTATWIAYGQAKHTSKHPETFGHGNIEGVIAPEAASNSKEGGSMLPTLAFGIPGSAVMAIVLVALLIQGIEPGPAMLREHLDLTWTLVTILIVANILATAMLLPLIKYLGKVAFIPGRLMVPGIMGLAAFAAYASRIEFMAIPVAFAFGILGYAMMKLGYNRVALLLGFILGPIVERYFFIITGAMGAGFLLRPGSIVLILLIVLILAREPLMKLRFKRKMKE